LRVEAGSGPPSPGSDESGLPGRYLALFCLTYFVTTTDSQNIPPVLPAVGRGFGAEPAALATLLPAYGLAAAMTSIVAGAASDRVSVRRALPWGYSLLIAGLLSCALAPSISLLLLGRVVTAAGASTLSLAMMVRIGELFRQRQGPAMGWFVMGGMAAAVVGLPLAAGSVAAWGWRAPFAGLFILAGLVGLIFVALERTQSSRESREGVSPSTRKLPSAGGHRPLPGARGVLVLSLGLIFNLSTHSMLAILGLWCAERFGFSSVRIFAYYIAAGLAGLAASPLAGRLAQSLGLQRTIFEANLGLMIVLPLVAYSPGPMPLLLLFMTASALAIGRIVPYHVLTLRTGLPGHQAWFVGLRNAISQLGVFAGAAAGGVIYTGLKLGYGAVGLFAGLACAAAWVLLSRLERSGGGAESAASAGPSR